MKKIFVTAIVSLLTVSLAGAFCCRRQASSCAPCEPVIPKCYKTVEVPAEKVVCPQPDRVIVEKVAPTCIRIPVAPTVIQNPDRIEYRCNPDRIIREKVADKVYYRCPAICNGYNR